MRRAGQNQDPPREASGEMVRLVAWRYGLKKVSLTRLIKDSSPLGLNRSKILVDRLTDGEEVEVPLAVGHDASDFKRAAQELGAVTDTSQDP